jgi:uncharacterized protein YbaR (Trm112 family)
MRIIEIEIKGTWAYSAPRLSKKRALRSGVAIKLRREPENTNDRNAVAVYHNRSKLGFVPREIASEIADYLDSNGVYSAAIISSQQTKSYNGDKYPIIYAQLKFHNLLEKPYKSDQNKSITSNKIDVCIKQNYKPIKNRENQKPKTKNSSNKETINPSLNKDVSEKNFILTCPNCGSFLAANQDYRNVKIACGACKEKFVYQFRFNCPLCKTKLEVQSAMLNDMIRCKICRETFTLTI